jgi:hypothetical protein
MDNSSNDDTMVQRAQAWRRAAMADGWVSAPTYAPHEGEDRAFTLTHSEGFKVQGISRAPRPPATRYTASLHCWAADGLAVKVPNTYDMDALREGVRACHYCKRAGVPTQRVGFAGRSCAACAPAEEAKLGKNYYA